MRVTGSMETYLNVFQKWEASGKDPQWCQDRGLAASVLFGAAKVQKLVHQAMVKHNIPVLRFRGSPAAKTAAITKALCAGYFLQMAKSSDPGNVDAPLWPADGLCLSTAGAKLFKGSALYGEDFNYVLYLDHLEKPRGDQVMNVSAKSTLHGCWMQWHMMLPPLRSSKRLWMSWSERNSLLWSNSRQR